MMWILKLGKASMTFGSIISETLLCVALLIDNVWAHMIMFISKGFKMAIFSYYLTFLAKQMPLTYHTGYCQITIPKAWKETSLIRLLLMMLRSILVVFNCLWLIPMSRRKMEWLSNAKIKMPDAEHESIVNDKNEQ